MPRDRPRLWESFKRALGSPSPSNEPEPDAEATPAGYAPPFLPPDEPGQVPAAPASTPLPTPVDRNPPVARPSSAALSEPMVAATADGGPRPTPAPPEAEEALRSPRLARGLASFSRDNADREKKFRHILSDEGGGKSKKP